MRLRSLSVAILAGVVLVPVSASTASAAGTTQVSAVSKTFKNSEAKRNKRAARVAGTTTVSAPRTTTTVVAAPAPAPAPAPVVSAPTTGTYADRVLARTNAERTSRGLRALTFSRCADGFADSWAGKLSLAGALSHQALMPILDACNGRSVGENVAYGNVSPEAMVDMWMNSAGHRANILNPTFTHIGVGDVTTSSGRVYAVQVFLTL